MAHYPDDDGIFGFDMRHKPPLPDLLTSDQAAASSNRLAYYKMNRQSDLNMSEYAHTTMGAMPANYVIVNARDICYNRDTALKVAHGRVAIPVKEYAHQHHLTVAEQWELMNPRYVGAYFGDAANKFTFRKPNLKDALTAAKEQGRLDEFMRQFWTLSHGHEAAMKRLQRRAADLSQRAIILQGEYMSLKLKISHVENDIYHRNFDEYYLNGYNVHEYLTDLKYQFDDAYARYMETKTKADNINKYLEQLNFEKQYINF